MLKTEHNKKFKFGTGFFLICAFLSVIFPDLSFSFHDVPMLPITMTATDKNGEYLDGNFLFKAAICTDASASLYSNDGTSSNCSEPIDSVVITFDDGVGTILLGDTTISGMSAMSTALALTDEDLNVHFWLCTSDANCEKIGVLKRISDLRAINAHYWQGLEPEDVLLQSQITDTDFLPNFDDDGRILTLGDTVSTSLAFVIRANTTSAQTKPAIRYNVNTSEWELSDDGTSFNSMVTPADAVTWTAGQIFNGSMDARGTIFLGNDLADSMTINATIQSKGDASVMVFEGATVDSFETTFAVNEPTADRTIKIPDGDGAIVLFDKEDLAVTSGANDCTTGQDYTKGDRLYTLLRATGDADGNCLRITETKALAGQIIIIYNNDGAGNTVNVDDIDNQVDLDGNADKALTTRDTLMLVYSGDRWVQVGTMSAN